MGFILEGLDTESYDRQYSDRALLRRILAYFYPYRTQMLVVGLLIAMNSVVGTSIPVLISRSLDVIARSPTTSSGYGLILAVLILGVISWGLNFGRQALSARVVGSVVLQLREDAFDATTQHDLSFFDEHPTGKTVSRITLDTQDFAQVVTLSMDLLSQVMLVAVLSFWLLSINLQLTLILFAMSPLAVGVALSFRRIARTVTRRVRRVTARINAQIQESIGGIVVAKSFRQEPALYARFKDNNQQAYHVGLRRGLTLSTIFPFMGMTSALGTALLIYVGGVVASEGRVTPGNWFLFMEAVGFYWFPMMSIASFWSQFQDGLSAAERVFALIDAEPAVIQTGPVRLSEIKGHIAFRHVCLSYTGEETVLPDLTLEIAPGETVALVGHTGAGKTSIARLIGRFYEFQGGEILIDGHDIRTLDLASYRQAIGFVPQEPFLFSGTVRDNIRYGYPAASDEQVRQTAERLGKGEWIAALPNGLDTSVGERGASLSSGQRQLVALARMLLKNPAILVLDEATASVDPFTEALIQEGLEEVLRDRTALIIAHRLSTVRNVDRIVVLRDGRIIEEGNHESLLATGGHYAELYNTYFRHQSLEYIERRFDNDVPADDEEA